jgi:hypothetical protein
MNRNSNKGYINGPPSIKKEKMLLNFNINHLLKTVAGIQQLLHPSSPFSRWINYNVTIIRGQAGMEALFLSGSLNASSGVL